MALAQFAKVCQAFQPDQRNCQAGKPDVQFR
jgi:hypothetical protein